MFDGRLKTYFSSQIIKWLSANFYIESTNRYARYPDLTKVKQKRTNQELFFSLFLSRIVFRSMIVEILFNSTTKNPNNTIDSKITASERFLTYIDPKIHAEDNNVTTEINFGPPKIK